MRRMLPHRWIKAPQALPVEDRPKKALIYRSVCWSFRQMLRRQQELARTDATGGIYHVRLEAGRFRRAVPIRRTLEPLSIDRSFRTSFCRRDSQGLVKVGDQIVRVLETDREANQAVGDPRGFPLVT